MGKDVAMGIKTVGAVLIVAACGGAGCSIAAAQRAEERSLRSLVQALELMRCELEYRVVPLPALCRLVSERCTGSIGRSFSNLASVLEAQCAPDATVAMKLALAETAGLPPRTKEALEQLGGSLGQFDLAGQLRGIDGTISHCQAELEKIHTDMDRRLRSYRTLGLCAGSAVALLLL